MAETETTELNAVAIRSVKSSFFMVGEWATVFNLTKPGQLAQMVRAAAVPWRCVLLGKFAECVGSNPTLSSKYHEVSGFRSRLNKTDLFTGVQLSRSSNRLITGRVLGSSPSAPTKTKPGAVSPDDGFTPGFSTPSLFFPGGFIRARCALVVSKALNTISIYPCCPATPTGRDLFEVVA